MTNPIRFQVGIKYPAYAIEQEGLVSDWNGNQLYFILFINKPTVHEIHAIKGSMHISVIEIHNIDWFTFIYEDFEADSHFAPGLFKYEHPTIKAFGNWNSTNDETITCPLFVFDSSNGELINIRNLTFNHDISEQIVNLAKSAPSMTPELYNYSLIEIYNKYTTKELNDLALRRGLSQIFNK